MKVRSNKLYKQNKQTPRFLMSGGVVHLRDDPKEAVLWLAIAQGDCNRMS